MPSLKEWLERGAKDEAFTVELNGADRRNILALLSAAKRFQKIEGHDLGNDDSYAARDDLLNAIHQMETES